MNTYHNLTIQYNKLGLVLAEGLLLANQEEARENLKKKSKDINYFAVMFVGLTLSKYASILWETHESRKDKSSVESSMTSSPNASNRFINKQKEKQEDHQFFQRLLDQKRKKQ